MLDTIASLREAIPCTVTTLSSIDTATLERAKIRLKAIKLFVEGGTAPLSSASPMLLRCPGASPTAMLIHAICDAADLTPHVRIIAITPAVVFAIKALERELQSRARTLELDGLNVATTLYGGAEINGVFIDADDVDKLREFLYTPTDPLPIPYVQHQPCESGQWAVDEDKITVSMDPEIYVDRARVLVTEDDNETVVALSALGCRRVAQSLLRVAAYLEDKQ